MNLAMGYALWYSTPVAVCHREWRVPLYSSSRKRRYGDQSELVDRQTEEKEGRWNIDKQKTDIEQIHNRNSETFPSIPLFPPSPSSKHSPSSSPGTTRYLDRPQNRTSPVFQRTVQELVQELSLTNQATGRIELTFTLSSTPNKMWLSLHLALDARAYFSLWRLLHEAHQAIRRGTPPSRCVGSPRLSLSKLRSDLTG
jgi:hypothetical protein